MKVLKVIKKVTIGILAVAFFAFAITMTVLLLYRNKYGITKIDGKSLVIIKNDIDTYDYKKGDLVIVEERDIHTVKIGEEVFTYRLDKTGIVNIDVGVVGEIHPDDDAITFENGSTYSLELTIGTPVDVHNKIGTYYGIVQSTWGFLFIILVPSFLIFIYEIYALIVEIKYGKEEAEAR